MLRNSTRARQKSRSTLGPHSGKNAEDVRASRAPDLGSDDCSIVAVAIRGSASVLGRAPWSTKNGTLSRRSRSRSPDPRVSVRRYPVNRRRHDPRAVEALDFLSGGYIRWCRPPRRPRGVKGSRCSSSRRMPPKDARGASAPPPGPPSSASSRSSPSPASACTSPAGGTRSRPSDPARATGSCARSRR